MVTLLHTADTHLGYRQYHRPEREADFRDAFDAVIDAAIDEEVDAVVHAGDLFDSSRPGIGTLSDALSGLKRLAEADIPFLSIVGNHDGTRDRQWVDVFASLGLATRLDEEGFALRSDGDGDGDTDGGQHLVLYGLDHVEPGRRNRLDYAFDRERAIEADTAMLVAHGLFEPFANGDWDARAIRRRSSVAFDAILAGDDHTNQETTLEEFGTLLTYPGSTERTAADQRDPRGYDLLTVSPEGGIEREFEELDTRAFVYVDVEMEGGDGIDRVLDALDAERGEGAAFEGSVLVVTLTGAGERVSSGPIEEFGLARDALTVRVNDRREFGEEEGEYGEVAFVDPDRAIEKRRRTLGLSEGGREIEALVRDGEAVPDSKVTDVVEGRVRERLDSSPGTLERSEPEPAEDDRVESGDGSEGEGESRGEGESTPAETVGESAARNGETDTEPAGESTLGSAEQDTGGESAAEVGTEPVGVDPDSEPDAGTAASEPTASSEDGDTDGRNEGTERGAEPDGETNDGSERTTQSTLWDR